MKKLGLMTVLLSLSFLAFAQDNEASTVDKWDLRECVEYALENNLTVQRNIFGVQSSEINVKQATWSMVPSLNMGGSYSSSWGRTIDPTTNRFVTDRFESVGFSAQSSWLLFQTNRLRNTYKQAKVDLEVSKQDLEATKYAVVLNVITFYTNVVFNKEQLNNNQSQLRSTERLVERTQKQVDAGAVPQSQLFDLLAQKATNEVNVINAENNYNISLLQLKQALQIPSFEPFEIEIPEVDLENFEMLTVTGEDVYDIALETMPNIKSANLGLESADLGVKVARAQLYPSLRLNGNVNTNYSSVRDSQRFVPDGTIIDVPIPATPVGTVNLDPSQVVYTFPTTTQTLGGETFEDYPFWDQWQDNIGRSVSISLNIPILNGLSASSNVQRALIAQKQAEITLLERKNDLRQNIERAYNDVLAAIKSYDASQRQVEAQEESFRVMERSYELGAMNFIDFQVSQNNLFEARTNLLIAKYDYIFKREILRFYMGDLEY